MMLYKVLCILYTLVQSLVTTERESRSVLINSGPIRGYKISQADVFEFHGIPYARVPTGTQRFKAPLPPPVWYETLEAVDRGIVCPQLFIIDDLPESPLMKEDCLIANIFVPDIKKNNLPVIIYIHGGAFVSGYGNLVTPNKFVSGRDIIAVTFNYRLSALGFLCLGTVDIPGNAGIKDQIALLRWVKKNIASFGGNPADVTISGYSAGSTAVDLLMLSKMAEGLFNKVIPESGSSLSPFSVQLNPIQTAKGYAKLIGNNNVDDIYELEYFYKHVPYEILQSGNVIYMKNTSEILGPCIEQDFGQEMFLDDSPVNILKKGNFLKIPMLYGFTNMEGLYRIYEFDVRKKDMSENFIDHVPYDLHFQSKEEKLLVANKIKQLYFGDKPLDNNSILDYINYMTHIMFVCPALKAINHLVKAGHNQIYLYEYSYIDENTPIIPYTNLRGANHCDQTTIVVAQFKENIYSKPKITKDFENMRNIMRDLWINFIKTGKPEASGVPTWPPVGKNWSPHMILNKTPTLGGSIMTEKCLFWEKIYDSYYNFPSSPFIPVLQNES